VVADPRSHNAAADWGRRSQTIAEVRALNDSAAAAIWFIANTRSDIARVQQRVRQNAEAAGERDEKKVNAYPLIHAGDQLKAKLDSAERALWVPPDTKGIVADTTALSRLFFAFGSSTSSWDPPNPTQTEMLRTGRAQLEAALAAVQRLMAADVAAYRRQVDEAGMGLFRTGGGGPREP
jgi:hypothetical protein